MVIDNNHFICAIDSGWLSSANYLMVWNMSSSKVIIEEQDSYFLVGDSCHQISEVLTKTFPEAEIKSEVDTAHRHRKLLFNICLYGEHTVMSENIFATLKWR